MVDIDKRRSQGIVSLARSVFIGYSVVILSYARFFLA